MTTELLAPAGGQEALVAAVQSGADAVYMGFGAFNARRSARNFSDEEFRVAVSYCHLRGVNLRAQYKYSVAWNKLFRRETMGNIRFNPSLHYIEDRNFAIQFVLNSKKVVSISETLYYYYRNGNSISNSAGQRQRVGQVYDTLEDIDILERSGEKLLYRDCAYANLLQLADFRLRQAKKYHMDDVQQELRPIIARARKAVVKGELPLKEKLRFLGEHYYYVLRGLRKK